MKEPDCYEQYPATTVIAANFLSLLIYGTGIFILFQFGLIWVAGYVVFILLLEFRLLRGHCTDCYYYGKTCAFGKGRLSARLFPRGRVEQFSRKTITWKEILPDFLVFIIPVIAGILLLLREFDRIILLLILALILLGFLGNALVRGNLACRFCRQRAIGCPAAKLFYKTKQ